MNTTHDRPTWADYRRYYGHRAKEYLTEHANIMSALVLALVVSLPMWAAVWLAWRWFTTT